MADRGHQGRQYQLCRAYALEHYDDCFRCGRPVDKLLSGRHLWGPTLDLKVPWSRGGTITPENSALSHNRCNAGYRDGRKLKLTVTPRARYSPSRAW
jgi:hypothetical protein